jgi:hypothetical protein
MSRAEIGPFRAWLRRQMHRQDPVGDFARDFLMDDCARYLTTLSSIDRHLKEDHDAEDRVLDVRDRAWREYAAKGRPM